ncbi:MAG: beta-galactosidase trimerization domain-containing protein, partial [Clostridia bacterium]|nr:beta-galactosidase trimerization domain-containing protein [Clostridia bacterium]
GPYDEEFFNAYGGFKNKLAADVDVIGIQDDLSQYKVIVIPNHRITTPEQAEKIKDFVQRGGIVVMNSESGTRDEFNRMYEMLEPGLFTELCGAEITENISAEKLEAQTGLPSEIEFNNGYKVKLNGKIFRIRLNGAESAAHYTTGRLCGTPAVTVNKFGNGFAVMYATDGNDIYFYEALAGFIKNRFNISPLLDADDGILVSSRRNSDKEFIFAVNMKDSPANIRLNEPMHELLTDRTACGTFTLDGYDAAVFEKTI